MLEYKLDSEQRVRIINLFSDDVSISEIARKLGVSRQSVYHVIDNVEKDPDIKGLTKEKIAELKSKLKALHALELSDIRGAVDNLFSKVLALSDKSPDLKSVGRFCIYCRAEMDYGEWESPSGKSVPGYRCPGCGKVFLLP